MDTVDGQDGQERQEPKLWNSSFILFLTVNTVAFLSFQILMPMLPVYGLGFSATESQIGFLAASISIAAVIIRPFSGALADRNNSKRIILLTQLGTAAVIVLFMAAPNIVVLIAARFVHGLLFGLGSTAVTVCAIRTMPESRMGEGIGILSVTGLGSLAVAPAIGIWVSERWGYPALFVFTCLIAAAAAFIVLAAKPEFVLPREAEENSFRFSFRGLFAVEALGLTGLQFIFTATTATITNFLVIFAGTRSIQNIGLYFLIYAVMTIIVRLLGAGLSDRYPFTRLVPVCAVLCVCGLAVIGFSSSILPLCVAAVLIGTGYGIVVPVIQTNAVRAVSPDRRGIASATFYFGMDFGFVAGPLSMGFIAEAAGYGAGFLCFIAPVAASIPLTFLLGRRRVMK
ncbi:MAG: MFS transporter [Clostridiales bacterium]|nr:MFS transporter [Clostridiales bacterium]